MTLEQAKSLGATHYAIEQDPCGDILIYFIARSFGYQYMNGLLLSEYDAHLLDIKPI